HFLGQNFAKAFDVSFTNKANQLEYVWATSWGVSTRLIGAMVLVHSDDDGLVMPPKIAPLQVIIVPIFKGAETKDKIIDYGNKIYQQLLQAGVRVKFDNDDNNRPGYKFTEYETKGVPIRIAIGLRDVDNQVAEVARRDTKEKQVVDLENITTFCSDLLLTIQRNLFSKAQNFLKLNTKKIDNLADLNSFLDTTGGFALVHWDGTSETEELFKTEAKATIRCIPLEPIAEAGTCIISGKPSSQRVYVGRAY
ncbi:MAG: His/Gly/Thr/Pro-type tRNA ligase C-terminal domain-containing protein, partial [Sediminibacterium sp.]|nr:His/Gly/Thr/Pro-type tRNA ligase C-terminal domain-containing protein [Sediminibacterium sp.]